MKLKHILALCMVLALVGCSSCTKSGGYTEADLKQAGRDAIRAYLDCAVAFSEGYQDVDTSGDYRKAYSQAVDLINERTACENAVTKSLQ